MAASARHFGWSLDRSALCTLARQRATEHPAGVWRLRLLCAPDGDLSAQALPLVDEPVPLRAALARTPIRSGDPHLAHKTTDRAVYEAHRAAQPDLQEVLLWNERGELTEFTTGTVVLRLGGRLMTPPLAAGVLPGVARAAALATGEISEALLTREHLTQAAEVWHLNSLRGWQPVVLSPN
ncbi:para-aminobenzoate synthase, component I (plasmid) [Deinococcus gobiensis I-0]|uniref:Para-aminobenzoate synthase, component I n=2 Tax=Deinococcus TaxID=1298 RepID=H8H094_DEIGI|nr:para-aminobenzoate synthase, component I [Deinococcus gobiensis I-0]